MSALHSKPPGSCGGSSFGSPSSSLAKPPGSCGGSSFGSPSSSLAKPTESQDLWQDLRRHTQARIGLGRSGDAQPTRSVLEFRAAHALARDAVRQPFDVGRLAQRVADVGLGEPVAVTSRASSREEYLRRPDLGRLPDDLTEIPCSTAQVGFVLCDGLSPAALTEHGVALLRALTDVVGAHRSIAAPVIATGARVALGDHIGQVMGVQTVVVLIGERPGLSVASSLGLYLTHQPRPGRTDAERNCVSNVHPPDGLGYLEAARVVDALITGARRLGRSGVDLKATSVAALDGSCGPGSTTLDQRVVS